MTVDPFVIARKHRSPEPADGRGRSARRRRFSRSELLDALRRWAEIHGEAPAQADWEPARARRLGQHWRLVRFEQGQWPTAKMVRGQFGTFGRALEAAGLAPARARPGKPHVTGPAEVLRAIRAWAMRYGEPPCNADWDPARARSLSQEWREVRYLDGDWPSLATVRFHFGSLGRAITAAGLEPARGCEDMATRACRRRRNRCSLAGGAEPSDVGPHTLSAALRTIAVARRSDDAQTLHLGLIALAAASLRWAEAARWAPEEPSPSMRTE